MLSRACSSYQGWGKRSCCIFVGQAVLGQQTRRALVDHRRSTRAPASRSLSVYPWDVVKMAPTPATGSARDRGSGAYKSGGIYLLLLFSPVSLVQRKSCSFGKLDVASLANA